MSGFAVFDTETNGLSPAKGARIIELAVVLTDEDGKVTGRRESLLNPNGPVGMTNLHRIRPCDVVQAPTFTQIAPDVIELLSGRVLVAHNITFDHKFLKAELLRAGYAMPETELLCTMRLSKEFRRGAASNKLVDVCADYGVVLDDAHRAMADTEATAHLLEAYIARHPGPRWGAALSKAVAWEPLAGQRSGWYRREDVGTENRTGSGLEVAAAALQPTVDAANAAADIAPAPRQSAGNARVTRRRRREFWVRHGLDLAGD